MRWLYFDSNGAKRVLRKHDKEFGAFYGSQSRFTTHLLSGKGMYGKHSFIFSLI